MTIEEILKQAALLGLEKAREWLSDQGITIDDEAVERGARSLRKLFQRRAVTNAKRLSVRDDRT